MKSSPLSIMLVVLLAAPAIRSQQGHGQSKLRRTVSQLQSEIEALQKSQQEMAEEIKALKELIGGREHPTGHRRSGICCRDSRCGKRNSQRVRARSTKVSRTMRRGRSSSLGRSPGALRG